MLKTANFKFIFERGILWGQFSNKGLQGLSFDITGMPQPEMRPFMTNPVWKQTLDMLLSLYFSGQSVRFDQVPVDLSRGTPFQQSVWGAACAIPYGQTPTYGEIASRMGNPKAARAVGNALGANPVCILVPCHRVIAAGNNLGGYSAGLHWKRYLLDLEMNATGSSRSHLPSVFQ